MNKSELVESIAAKASLSLAKSEDVIDVFLSSMTKTLAQNGRVEIRGFGALAVKNYEAYRGRNPKTGESIDVPAKTLPVWRTGMELRKRVEKGHTPNIADENRR